MNKILITFCLIAIFTIYRCQGTSSYSLPQFNYTLPDFTNTSMFISDLSSINSDSFMQSIYMDVFGYLFNNCTDSRVESLFSVTQADDFSSYQGFCMALATDTYQIYANYSCNNWICNFNGTCKFSLNSDQTVNQTCACNSGWAGLGCQYSSKNYIYGLNWLNGTVQWLNRKYISNNGSLFKGNVSEFSSYVELSSSLLFFGSSINMDSITQNNLKQLIAPIFNSNVTLDNSTQDEIQAFVDSILLDPVLSSLVDPMVAISLSGSSNKADKTFGSNSADVDPNNDVSLTFGSRRILFSMAKKFLQAANNNNTSKTNSTSTTQTTKGINMDNPRCTVPKDVTSKLPTGSKLSLSFVRDPKSYNKNATNLNGYVIQSQVLSIGANVNKTATPFPSGVSTPLSCNIPFANYPLNCVNFQQNCQVMSFNNGVWKNETSCTLGANTNGTRAVINCNTFGTVAVTCNRNCKVDTTALGSVTKRTNTTTNKTTGSFIAFSTIFISLLISFLV